MKRTRCFKLFFVFSLSLIFGLVSFPQKVIENPEKPQAENAGRVVELEEILTISEDAGDFFFQYPYNPKIAPDGSLYIQDQELLLRFDSDGKFVRNYFKKGQGPGELIMLSNYILDGGNIVVHDRMQRKIARFDSEGKLLEEFRFPEELKTFSQLVGKMVGGYCFSTIEGIDTGEKFEVMDLPGQLSMLNAAGTGVRHFAEFPIKTFVFGGGGARAWTSIAELNIACYQNRLLFVSHTQDYLVKALDPSTGDVLFSLTRKYPRVKTPKEFKSSSIGTRGNTQSAPRQEFLNDIRSIMVVEEKLWVMTSTWDDGKGVLFDVFSPEGRYLDCFFIRFPEGTDLVRVGRGNDLCITEDFLLKAVRTEDETYVLKKYRLVGR